MKSARITKESLAIPRSLDILLQMGDVEIFGNHIRRDIEEWQDIQVIFTCSPPGIESDC